MFKVGQKVVYPGHGVAKINRILEKIVSGIVFHFYELTFLNKDVVILVPVANAESIGVRTLCSSNKIKVIFETIVQPVRKISLQEMTAHNWNKRKKNYHNEIRTGKFEKILEIYRDLKFIEQNKELSFGEKNLLNQTEALIVEEIAAAKEFAEEKAIEYLRSCFTTASYKSRVCQQL